MKSFDFDFILFILGPLLFENAQIDLRKASGIVNSKLSSIFA